MELDNYKAFFDESVELIKQALNEQYLSIFAGAGISVLSDLPKWKDLMRDISYTLYKNKESSDDYLVLAEKFYNAYGKNRYYKKLKELIHYDYAQPNDLHKLIVNLDIKNLITTNWDNLFEKAIEKEGQFYNIIRKDEDIGYSSGFSKFIKMHGCFEDQNIVFREKDYLEYSSNFPLIENYLKGVFSTDCVLLMGYSLSDNNVKQIINWVNSKATNIKPVYFIRTDKSYDYHEFDFYKNKNIHILYLIDVTIGIDSNDKNKESKLLQSFLNLLTADKSFDINKIDKDKESDIFNLEQEFESFLDKYNKCEFVHPNILIQDIQKFFHIGYGSIFFSSFIIKIKEPRLVNLKNKEDIYNKISKLTLSKVILEDASYGNIIDSYDLIDEDSSIIGSIKDELIHFDYDSIAERIKKISFKEESSQNRLNKAFLLYKSFSFEDAYKEVRLSSIRAFKEKDYTSWCIAEINKEYFIWEANSFTIYKDRDYLLRKDTNLDLDEKYLKLPLDQREILKGLKNIDTFFLKLERDSLILKNNAINNFFKKKKNILEYKYYHCIFNDINTALYIIKAVLNFEVSLSISVGLKSVCENTVESLLINYFLKFTLEGDNVIVTLDDHIISAIIYYLSPEKLLEILNTYSNDDIIFLPNNINVMEQLFENIYKKFNTKTLQDPYRNLFNNFLIFAAWIQLDQNCFDVIIDKFINKLKENILDVNEIKNIGYFLDKQYTKNKMKNLDKAKEIIYSYINLVLTNKFSRLNIISLQYSSLVNNIVFLIKKEGFLLDEKINKNILMCIDILSSKHILDQFIFFKLFLLDLYEICDENIQSELNKFASKIYVNLKDYVSKSLPQKDSKETSEQRSTNPVPIEEYILAMLEIGFYLYKSGQSINFDKEDYVKQFNHIKSTSKSSNKNSNIQDLFQNFKVLDFISNHEKYIDHK